jgi:hypothetical protein
MQTSAAFSRAFVIEPTAPSTGGGGTGGGVTPPTGRAWLSGEGGQGATDGTFGAWRGTPVTVAATWADVVTGAGWDAAYELLDFHGPNDPQGYGVGAFWQWNGAVDLAVGGPQNGETWALAASGGMDARWTKDLTKLQALWYGAGKTGQLYLRMAHEFNLHGYPWKVVNSDVPNYIAGFRRWAALCRSIVPQAKILWSVSADSSADLGLNFTNAYPGTDVIDVHGVDYYNMYPWVNTAPDFTANSLVFHPSGAPKGIEQHRLYAQSKGKPLAISEWSNPESLGEATGWLQAFHDWIVAHAGTGSGQVLYECLFNDNFFYTGGTTRPAYSFFPATSQPATAALYRTLWGV